MAKPVSAPGNWSMFDDARTFSKTLEANTDTTEQSGYAVTFTNSGFTVPATGWAIDTGKYIFVAFAAKPDAGDILKDSALRNYATLDLFKLHNPTDVLSNGNLEASWSGGSACLQASTLSFSSGKAFYEFYPGTTGNIGAGAVGIRRANNSNYDGSYAYTGAANKLIDGAGVSGYGDTYGDGDVIGVAVDMDAGTLTFYKNGVSQGIAFSGITGSYVFFQGTYGGSTSGGYGVNYGQKPFRYPVEGYTGLYR